MTTKCLFLEPLVPKEEKWGTFSKIKTTVPPLGMLSIVAYIKEQGLNADLIDPQISGISEDELTSLLKDRKYDIVGIPVFTNSCLFSFSTAQLIRKALPECLIVLGGVHATSLSERTMNDCPEADICVIGEGEYTMKEIIENYKGNRQVEGLESIKGIGYVKEGRFIKSQPREHIMDVDSLPNIYEHYRVSDYTPGPQHYRKLPAVQYVAQRGCPFQCVYCEAPLVHGHKIRAKSVNTVIDELKYLIKEQGVKSVSFQDSTFTLDRKYTMDLCQAMIDNNLGLEWTCTTRVDRVDPEMLNLMSKSGCWQVCYGIESANPESLVRIKKGGKATIDCAKKAVRDTKKAKMKVLTTFILALPGEDFEMSMNTIRFAKELKPQTALFFLPVPYPGSELYRMCLAENGIRVDAKWEHYLSVDMENPVYVNPKIGKEGMVKLYNAAFKSFYLSPTIWIVNLMSIRTFHEFSKYSRAIVALYYFLKGKLFYKG